MGRTAGNFCLRSSMPQPLELEPEQTETIEPKSSPGPPVNTPSQNMPATEAMTWQQEKAFGQNKATRRRNGCTKWEPFDYAALEGAPTQAEDNWLAQQSDFTLPTLLPTTRHPRRRHRGKAVIPISPSDQQASFFATAPAPAEPAPAQSTIANDARDPPKSPHKKNAHNKKQTAKDDDNMVELRKEAYVPPHLRKRNAPNHAKPDSAHGAAAASGSPAVSDKSKTPIPAQLYSSTNGAGLPKNPSSSPPTTPQDPEDHVYGWPRGPQPNKKTVRPKAKDMKYVPSNSNSDGGKQHWGNGWDEPKPEIPAATKKGGNPRWPRGPQPYKKTGWPKAREMKYIPPGSDSDGGISFKSTSNGDPDYDIKKLVDWNGDWLPPPETWSARRGYTDRHFGQNVERWMNAQPAECTRPLDITSDAFHGCKTVNTVDGSDVVEFVLVNGVCKELAPHYWIRAKVEKQTLREFWKRFLEAEPKPFDQDDLKGDSPWWERYEDVVYKNEDDEIGYPSCYLDGVVVPEAKINLADPEEETQPFHLASAEEKVQEQKRRREQKNLRMIARRNRPMPEFDMPLPVVEDRRLKPQANIYLRPVQASDVRGIAELYNYYVESSIYTTEFDGRTEAQMAHRIQVITRAGLPYLVAICKSNESKANPGYVTERIVGYINIDEYCDPSSLYRYTFEMEIYVHPGLVCKGIGKCLMDRLLAMVDTSYCARGGYKYVNDFEYLKNGPSRVIKTILLNVHHENGDDVQIGWQGKFLNDCQFVRVGRLPKVGYKLGKVVDVSIYAHHTEEDINADGRPTVAG
ncbi:hypothetical protein BDW02DRAFT_141204 [Decorospora gaudefroyi]|uniref:N-acetyltransferase domain-containing protein n=1 Tax=Decorospora gaudefroyi TaxID=184978 RepID=A0A6A5KUW5_9PLEO|nr:hypothetical protein BDW02DRAFT_141204 [Decorospora gaudefroyi]